MLWIHPFIQAVATLLALLVLYQGYVRFMFAHFKKKGAFPWKKHVNYGLITMTLWITGVALGVFMTHTYWSVIGVTEWHYYIGLGMIPGGLFGIITGLIMDKIKKRRKVLPLLHGVNNFILVLCALYQFYSGIEVIRTFLL
ncbi:MAG: DUF4079 domain-containing protein [Desulfovibrio sp.]